MMDDRNLLNAFLAHRLEPAAFDHRDHVRVAWLLLERFGLEAALQKFETAVLDLAGRAGVPEKYHATITRALMHIIAADQACSAGQSCSEYCASRPAVLEDAQSLLLSYYSPEKLFSEEARKNWCAPDLRPLPEILAASIVRSA